MLNPDTLETASGEELRERQRRTGELGDGKTVVCYPNPADSMVVQQVPRAMCLSTPYAACLSCPHHQFEYIFAMPVQEDWVLCPRWKGEAGTGPPSFYTPVWLSECRGKPHPFCPQCPEREELIQLRTDKQRNGWLERYQKLTRDDDE